jgi:DNA-binding HxlR family transcriptional regulator
VRNDLPTLCPRFHYGIEVLGRRWTGAIVMQLMQSGGARFNELLVAVPGISDRLLAERLRELESEGITERTVEPGPPVRVSYRLTEAGRALEPALVALGHWAEAWIPLERAKANAS